MFNRFVPGAVVVGLSKLDPLRSRPVDKDDGGVIPGGNPELPKPGLEDKFKGLNIGEVDLSIRDILPKPPVPVPVALDPD